ncbi:MAG: lysozyme inhibitor LprI family protein [Zoogloeaceae bacterium]|nr:lysozyme inhibitor LprI family protein [Zoogloeaceae bacterium]
MRYALIGALWLPLAAQSASFDCSSAKSAFEQAVCGDAKLSALDEEMAQGFRAAMEKMADGKAAFRAQQRAWLAWMRKRSAPDLEDAYQWRIQYLNELPIFPAVDAAMEKVADGPVFSTTLTAQETRYTLNIYMLNACKDPDFCEGPTQLRFFRQDGTKAPQIINMPNLFAFKGNSVEALLAEDGGLDVCIQSGVNSKEVYRLDPRESRLVFRRSLDQSAGGPYYRTCEYQDQE